MNRSQGNLIYLDLWNFKYNQVLRYLSLVNLVQEFIQSPSEFRTISDLYIKVRYDQKRIGAETWKVRTFKSLLFRWFPSFRLWHFIEKLFCMGIFPYGRKGKSDAFKLFTSAEKAYDYYKNALDSCNVFQTALNKRPSSLRPSDLRRAGFHLIWPARSFRIVAWLWNFHVCRAELLNSGRGALFFLFFVIHLPCRTETVERLIRYEERWISFRLFLVIIFTSTLPKADWDRVAFSERIERWKDRRSRSLQGPGFFFWDEDDKPERMDGAGGGGRRGSARRHSGLRR